MRTAHPPTCPYPECEGRSFSQQKGLRAHLKIHEGREVDGRLDGEEDAADEDEPAVKKRRGGEHGRDWICDFEGCTKDFKSVFYSSRFRFRLLMTAHLNRKRLLPRIKTSRTSTTAILCALRKVVTSLMATSTFFNDMLHGHIDQQSRLIAPVIRKTIIQKVSGWISTELQGDPIWRETPGLGRPYVVPIPTFLQHSCPVEIRSYRF